MTRFWREGHWRPYGVSSAPLVQPFKAATGLSGPQYQTGRPYDLHMRGQRLLNISTNDGSLSALLQEYHVISEDPEAIDLADLVSISSDLAGALLGCTLFVEEAEKDTPDTARLRVFFEAAIISYARAFASGKGSGEKARRKISAFVEELGTGKRATHEEAVRIRNKHVGHRVDQAEQSAFVVAIFDRQSLNFKSVSPMLMDRLDGQLIADLALTVQALVTRVDETISNEMDQLTRKYATEESEGRLQLPEALAGLTLGRG